MTYPLRGLVALSFLALASCDSVTAPEEELARQRRIWEQAEPVAYVFEMQRSCFCTLEGTSAVTVEVQDGSALRRFYTVAGDDVGENLEGLFPDIDGIFEIVAELIGRRPYHLEVEYHPVRGYPTSIIYDFDERMADDELSIIVRDFRLGDPG